MFDVPTVFTVINFCHAESIHRSSGGAICDTMAPMLNIFKAATPEALTEIAEEMKVRQTKHFILLFSMGSQFDHLIVHQLRNLGVFAVVADPSTVTAADVSQVKPA